MIHVLGVPDRRMRGHEEVCTIDVPATDIRDHIALVWHADAELIEEYPSNWYCPACGVCSIEKYDGEA